MSKLLGIAIAALLAAGGVSAQNSTSICAKGLKMFVSRGTGEAMGTGDDTGLGATGKLVKSIAEQIDGSSYQGIPYPADWGNTTTYFQSVGNGTELLRQMITEYATSCPDSKIAVFGYSQGAQVTTNNFCGTAAIWEYFGSIASGSIPDDTEVVEAPSTLPETVTKNVVAVVLFGDPTHRQAAAYNHGNSTGSGMFWRSDYSACLELGDRIRSYCDAGDPFCDLGKQQSTSVHGTYLNRYEAEIANYVVEQYNNASENSSDAGSNSTPPPVSGAGGLLPMTVSTVAVALTALSMV